MHLAWQMTGDKHFLESLYASQIEASALREYMNKQGSMWIDRVDVPYAELQRARLGGIAMIRGSLYPGHSVSWTFHSPANEESAAILIPNATPQSMKIVVYNLGEGSIRATMTAWDFEPGRWQIEQGVDRNGDDVADGDVATSTVDLERTGEVELTFPPRTSTILNLKLVDKGIPYWTRPDLGMGIDDVVVKANKVTVTVHSLGAVDAPPTEVVLLDGEGKTIASAPVPGLRAPVDLLPKKFTVTLTAPPGSRIGGGSIVLDPNSTIKEITRINNRVKLL
jgi:hypothetical protein